MLENNDVDYSLKLYREAIGLYEQEDKDMLSGDVYRSAGCRCVPCWPCCALLTVLRGPGMRRQCITMLVKNERYDDAAELLMRWAESFDRSGNANSQGKCYFSAIVMWMYAERVDRAWQLYQELLDIDSFAASGEADAIEGLFERYAAGDSNVVKAFIKSAGEWSGQRSGGDDFRRPPQRAPLRAGPFTYMEPTQMSRMAARLPTGDFSTQSAKVAALMNDGEGGDLDENDLT